MSKWMMELVQVATICLPSADMATAQMIFDWEAILIALFNL
jgi:hypothetical protein